MMDPETPQSSDVEIPDEEFAAAASPPDLSGRVSIRCERALQAEIESIAEDSRYPLNSVSQVVRYCCLAGLERLRQWRPKNTIIGQIQAANSLMLRDKLQADALEMLDRLDQRIEWYIQSGFYDEAIDIAGRIAAHFSGLEGFWAEYVRAEIDKRFDGWMNRIDEVRGKYKTNGE